MLSMETAKRLESVKEYYFSLKLKEVRELINSGKEIINLGIGSPDLQPPKEVISALVDSLGNQVAHKYQSYQGIPELRQAIANFYKSKYKVSLDSETEVLPLMGSKEGILHISMAYLDKGDQVLIPNPGYPTYTSVTNLVEAEPVYYDLKEDNNWLPDIEALRSLDLSKVKMMWLCYPNMPTGAPGDLTVFKELVDFVNENNILLVNDNPYSFILNDNPCSLLSLPNTEKNCIEFNSLSKTFNMAGWRVGMVVGNVSIIKNILKVKSNMDSGMFYGLQMGAIEALKLSNDWFEGINSVYKKRLESVRELADKLGCTYDVNATGMFVWAKIKGDKTSEEFIDELLYDKGIFIAPGTIFGSNGEGFVRFSLCATEEEINKAISRL
jgi:LL-diaminopimelate aminotransferase